MKNTLKTALFAAGLFVISGAYAQAPRKDPSLGDKIGHSAKTVGHATASAAKSVGHATAKTATTVGHKTSEIAAKGDAAVVDKRYEGKVAPNGENVYINNKKQYYYVDKKGHRVYLKWSQLRNKR